MASQGVKRRLTTILAADVVGYSRLMGEDEVGTLAALKTHRAELVDPTIASHGGRIVKTTGDGMLVEFPSVVEAVQCAVEMQQAMADRNAGIPEDQRIIFRIGVNLGDVIVEGDDIYGDGVNVAARLEGLAEPGGIAVAATVREHIDGKVEAHFEDAGEHLVKNMARALRVWRWHGAGSPAGADDRLNRLSERERQIAELYANGQTYKEIAEALYRSPSTIRNHLNAIYQKLKIGNKVELVQLVLARRARAVPPEDAASDADQRDAIETVAEATLQPSQERRQVTLMALELDIREQSGGPVDIELLEANFAEFADQVRGEFEAARGSVITVLGNRVVACLGWPAAHEDDAERATRAALAIQDAAGRLPRGADLVAQCRIGLATGTIIVGGSRGHDGAPELFLGDTLIVAEALLAAAEPGQTLLTEAIRRRLAGLFEIHECDAAAAAGFAAHGKAFVVERELAGSSRFEARVGPTPLKMVGRDEELALLMGRWRRAKAGEGQAVLLVGEAGIGKSRIVRAMIDATAGESVRLIRYQCTPNHRDTALWPIVTQLLAAAGIAGEDPDEQKLAKLARVLDEAGPEVMEAIPLIAALVGIADADPEKIFAELPPQIRRAKTLDSLIRYAIELSKRSPLMLVFEDIHWADPSTNELLEQLIEAISGHAVLLLMTSRPSENRGLADHLHLAQLSISRLDRQGTTSIVREVAGAAQVPDAWLDAVFERADGIPLFIEELTKSFVEATVSAGRNRHGEAANPALPLAIPETLHDLLAARLDRLPIDKEVAQIAACIGREFSHELLTAAAEKPDAVLQSTLDQLVSSGLVFMRGTPPEASYLFKHALIRDAAYDSLLRKQRKQHHARIAMVLEERFPDVVARQPELIAHHLAEGGQSARAIEFWMTAVHQALPRAAYREAVTFVDHGLAAADAQADSTDMLAAAVDLRFLKYAAQFPLGEPQLLIKILAEAERKAFELNDPIRLCRVLSSQSWVLASDGQVDDAIAVGQRGAALITENDDPHWFVMAKLQLARALYAAGRYAEAIHQVTDTMGFLGEDVERGKRSPGFLNQTVSARAWLVLFHAERGDFEAGERHGEDGLRLAQSALCGDHERLWVRNAIGRMNVVKGDFGAAIETLEPFLAVCENIYPVYLPRVASSLGAAYVASGQVERGVKLLRQAEDQARSMSFEFGRALALAQLAEALLTAGEISEPRDKATDAIKIARDAGERGNEGWATCMLGEVAYKSGQREDAEARYRQALEIAEALEMAPLQARCIDGLRRCTN